ncbi:helix-turn-helix domain-containing protein [Trichlorobacter lovleyi]|uniref:helix-turn-helix domain-containing protein n=1 Tax=Trichlorobacter lovleyi TaxID=313985 RepID=UPI0023F5966B|nr:helix-turn-helix transcriptional regulator [Trichlorobacter lovleyi]
MKTNGNSTRFISSEEIGRAIKQRRLALGMSQEKLAEQLDVSYQQVQRYESGSSKLNVENIQTLAMALDMPVTFFFNPENLLIDEPSHPYTSDEEYELITSFRTIKHPSYKDTVISVVRMAAQLTPP